MATQLSGKVGQLIYRQTKYGTVVYEAPAKASVPPAYGGADADSDAVGQHGGSVSPIQPDAEELFV